MKNGFGRLRSDRSADWRWKLNKTRTTTIALTAFCVLAPFAAPGQESADPPMPDPVESRSEGDGPYERLILRGGYLVDGTGAPAQGPVDIYFMTALRRLHKKGYLILGNLAEAAADHQFLLAVILLIAQGPDLDGAQKGSMIGQDSEFPSKTGRGNNINIFADNCTFRSYYL